MFRHLNSETLYQDVWLDNRHLYGFSGQPDSALASAFLSGGFETRPSHIEPNPHEPRLITIRITEVGANAPNHEEYHP
jgi:hypothetical protein